MATWNTIGTGDGTVTSVSVVSADTDTLTVTGSPITTSGTITLDPAVELKVISDFTTQTGIQVRLGAPGYAFRSIAGTTNQINVASGNGVAGDPTLSLSQTLKFPGQGAIKLPNGTTAQRPGSPEEGMIRYNTDILRLESYYSGSWNTVGSLTLTGDVTGSGFSSVATTLSNTIDRPSGMTWTYGNDDTSSFTSYRINNSNVTTFKENFLQTVTAPASGYVFQYYRPIPLPPPGIGFLQVESFKLSHFSGASVADLMLFGVDNRMVIGFGLNMNNTNIDNVAKIGIGVTGSSIHAPLQFDNGLVNRKIVLYEGTNNDHQFNGFGVNSGSLRYQVNNPGDGHIFYNATSSTTSDELLRIDNVGVIVKTGTGTIYTGKIGIGVNQTSTHAPLQFDNGLVNRKIVLYEGTNNDHQYDGFGVNTGLLRYQITNTADSHVFYAATSSTTSTELLRIKGNGDIIVNSGTTYVSRLPSGWMYMEGNATTTTVTPANSWVKAAGTTTSGSLNVFTMPTNNRLLYSGTPTISAFIQVNVTIKQGQLLGSVVSISIHKNGTRITGSNTSFTVGSLQDLGALSSNTIVSLSTNDYVELFVTDSVNGATVTVQNMSFGITAT